ncbi:hypothetical protein NR402_14705 [Acidithiobacillus ferrooxidans]|jgi:hypothetical protein|uniref:hypothetical protein n=1 Tax=Acidithiobacillus ferrooxidans TaxID=920 RepID=UPI00214C133D|nr:hypothetical protein [Acidithiobacillus ferrooxidans]MCR2831525.1 hypothetical protein [Acidithiobacillus ferrooxidans]
MSTLSHVFDLPAQKSELLIFFTLLSLSVIIFAARMGGEIAARPRLWHHDEYPRINGVDRHQCRI